MTKGTQIFSLQGKTALITGATGNLGSEMALILAEAGAHVLVNSRSRERSESVVERLLAAGHSAEPAVFDVTNQAEISGFFSKFQGKPLHILVNNACAGAAGSVASAKAEAYVESYDITVISAHNMLIAGLPAMRQAVQQDGDASVINLGTMYAMVSPDLRIYASTQVANPPFYGAAKAALLQWTRYAACEFGPEGIRINSISPGPFPSATVKLNDPPFIQRLINKVPLGRVGLPDEIKGPTLFLASPASSFVNGANIVVDGGWTSW